MKLQNKITTPKTTDNPKVTLEEFLDKKIITQTQYDIIKHKASKKVIVGGKGTGKTHMVQADKFIRFENENYFNAFGFRKYKDQSSTKLASYFSNFYFFLKHKGLKIGNYKGSTSHFQKITSQRDANQNQKFMYGSLENITGSTDGGAPSNGGYYGIIEIDEPVVKQDIANPDKIPNIDKWNEELDLMQDNLFRFRTRFNNPVETIWMTMNWWGDHPETIATDKYLPIEQFKQYNFNNEFDDIFGNLTKIDEWFDNQDNIDILIKNSTQQYYDEENDTLYVRNTKFANPSNVGDPKAYKVLINSIKVALKSKNENKLAIAMGYKHMGDVLAQDTLVYNIKEYNNAKLEDFYNQQYKPEAVHYSIDVDTSRVMTITPTFLFSKFVIFDGKESKIFIDKQIELPCNGTGEYGEKNAIYMDQIVEAIDKHYLSIKLKTPKFKVSISVDDKRKIYLDSVKNSKVNRFTKQFRIFKQHKAWDLIERQNLTHMGFSSGIVYNHIDNKSLETDMNVCVRQDVSSPKRKASGRTNYLDRIDSMEQGLIEFGFIIEKAFADRGKTW